MFVDEHQGQRRRIAIADRVDEMHEVHVRIRKREGQLMRNNSSTMVWVDDSTCGKKQERQSVGHQRSNATLLRRIFECTRQTIGTALCNVSLQLHRRMQSSERASVDHRKRVGGPPRSGYKLYMINGCRH